MNEMRLETSVLRSCEHRCMQFGNLSWSSLTLKGKREGDINPQIPHISRSRIRHQWQEIPLKSASLYTPSSPLKDITANRQSKSTCFLYVQHMLFWRHLGGGYDPLSLVEECSRGKKSAEGELKIYQGWEVHRLSIGYKVKQSNYIKIIQAKADSGLKKGRDAPLESTNSKMPIKMTCLVQMRITDLHTLLY